MHPGNSVISIHSILLSLPRRWGIIQELFWEMSLFWKLHIAAPPMIPSNVVKAAYVENTGNDGIIYDAMDHYNSSVLFGVCTYCYTAMSSCHKLYSYVSYLPVSSVLYHNNGIIPSMSPCYPLPYNTFIPIIWHLYDFYHIVSQQYPMWLWLLLFTQCTAFDVIAGIVSAEWENRSMSAPGHPTPRCGTSATGTGAAPGVFEVSEHIL
jgi:hypothetical protein